MATTQVCTKCGKRKPLDAFDMQVNGRPYSRCRCCSGKVPPRKVRIQRNRRGAVVIVTKQSYATIDIMFAYNHLKQRGYEPEICRYGGEYVVVRPARHDDPAEIITQDTGRIFTPREAVA